MEACKQGLIGRCLALFTGVLLGFAPGVGVAATLDYTPQVSVATADGVSKATITFETTNKMVTNVDVRYRQNGGTEQGIRMAGSGGRYVQPVLNAVKPGDVLTFYFGFQINFSGWYNTCHYTYTVGSSSPPSPTEACMTLASISSSDPSLRNLVATPDVTPPATTSGTPTTTIVTTTTGLDYTPGISIYTDSSTSRATISFETTNAAVTNVDVRYRQNGGAEQGLRMTWSGGRYVQPVLDTVKPGDALTFYFAFQVNSGGWYNTCHYAYTVGSSTAPSPTETCMSLASISGSDGSVAPVPAPVPTPDPNGRFPVYFANNTRGFYNDNQIFIYALGMNASNQWCYVAADGTMRPMNKADESAPNHLTKNGRNYANYAFTLAQARNANFRMPDYITGGRFYVSVGSPMYISLGDGIGTGWGGPDLLNPTDPNNDVIFDWYEFTWINNGTFQYGGNTGQVDMFGLPLTHEVKQDFSNYDEKTGIALTRDDVFSRYSSTVSAPFRTLVDASKYRIKAPIKGSFRTGEVNGAYMTAYIDQVWNQWASTPFTLTRLQETFTGRVVNGMLQFYKNGKGPYYLRKPSSSDVFGCEGNISHGVTSDLDPTELQMGAELCAAFHRGVAQDTTKWYDPSAYYTNAVKDEYAMFWHKISTDGKAYGFAYDDVNLQSSVKILPNAKPPTSLTITVGW